MFNIKVIDPKTDYIVGGDYDVTAHNIEDAIEMLIEDFSPYDLDNFKQGKTILVVDESEEYSYDDCETMMSIDKFF